MKNKGISLITLIITIVVVIILAAAVILALGNNNPIVSARVSTVSQTKDSVESSVLLYVTNIKAKTLGELSTDEILIINSTYSIIEEGSTATITVDGNNKALYKISKEKAKKLLNLELKEETNGAWYIETTGRTWLVYNDKPSVPTYLMENDEILSTVSSFVTYAGSITTSPVTPTNPDPTSKDKYTAKDIYDMSDVEKRSVIGKNVNLTSTNGWNDWKVFSSDGKNIVLITGDYVPVSKLESGHGFVTSGDYKVYSSTSRDDLMAKLTKSETYVGFKDADEKVVTSRIPTIEDFTLSYNAVSHDGNTYNNNLPLTSKVYYKLGINNGYNVANDSDAKSNDNISNNSYNAIYMPQIEINYRNLWIIDDSTKAYGYWLNSASSYSADYTLTAYCIGGIGYIKYNTNNRGLRPIVVLNSNCKLVKKDDGEGNITYDVELDEVKYSASDIYQMSDIDKRDVIGKYTNNYVSDNGYNKWKVFYSDKNNIALIAENCIPLNNFEDNGITLDFNKVNNKFVYSKTNGIDFLNNLKSNSTFIGFYDNNKGTNKIASAVRIPTIEDFCTSYNSVSHDGIIENPTSNTVNTIQKIYYKYNESLNGYNIAAGSSTIKSNEDVPDNSYLSGYGIPHDETYYGDLWMLNDANYWLASSNACGENYMCDVRAQSYINNTTCLSNVNDGLRPIAILNSNVQLSKHVNGSNITYELK